MGRPISIILGKPCSAGHLLKTQEDLYSWVTQDGKLYNRCKACMNISRQKLRNMSYKPKPKFRFEIGKPCSAGHMINSEADCDRAGKSTTGEQRYRCRICRNIKNNRYKDAANARSRGHTAEQSRLQFGKPQAKREIYLDCDHKPIFLPPNPLRDEIIYCVRCKDYRIVVGWGDGISYLD